MTCAHEEAAPRLRRPARPWRAVGWLAAALVATPALASDHADTPYLTADPAVDITDVFAWTDDGLVNLAMTLRGRPGPGLQYVFHWESRTSMDTAGARSEAICRFLGNLDVECWVGSEGYAVGGARNELVGLNGLVRVRTGFIDDPAFGDVPKIRQMTSALAAARTGSSTVSCPQPSETERQAILQTVTATGTDSFARQKVFLLMLRVDPSVLTTQGPLLGVWASVRAGS